MIEIPRRYETEKDGSPEFQNMVRFYAYGGKIVPGVSAYDLDEGWFEIKAFTSVPASRHETAFEMVILDEYKDKAFIKERTFDARKWTGRTPHDFFPFRIFVGKELSSLRYAFRFSAFPKKRSEMCIGDMIFKFTFYVRLQWPHWVRWCMIDSDIPIEGFYHRIIDVRASWRSFVQSRARRK